MQHIHRLLSSQQKIPFSGTTLQIRFRADSAPHHHRHDGVACLLYYLDKIPDFNTVKTLAQFRFAFTKRRLFVLTCFPLK